MKMVNSLLLTAAAGLVAVSGAQAADLPVKAKPVEYVKVCSLYGVGFYYIPGTDICMKLGGYVRYQVSAGMGNSISFGPFATSSGFNTRATGVDVGQRVRVVTSMDTRQQTAYGTLRTYLTLGWTHDTPANTTSPAAPGVYFNRGFIQFAGFTFGKATSFFDFASTAAVAYNAGYVTTSDTGDAGQIVGSYTGQLGNGLSWTVGIEQSRRDSTTYVSGPASTAYSMVTGPARNDLGGALGAGTASRPDIVGNLRVDQAWGGAQIMAAYHDVSAQYYGSATGASTSVLSGGPGDKWGFAAGAGLRLNAPMIGAGDYFQAQVTYAEGATKYTTNSSCGGSQLCDYWNGSNFGFGFAEDANYTGTLGSPGSIQLTTSWSVFASYEHFWTPSLRTSVYGSYFELSRNTQGNANICNSVAAGLQCNGDWSMYTIGTRSQWNITKDFYVGVDVIYNKLNSATINNGLGFVPSANMLATLRPSGVYNTADQDAVTVTWRVHRDIAP